MNTSNRSIQPATAEIVPSGHPAATWLGGVTLLLAFAGIDVATVARAAGLLNVGELVAGAAAFVLIAGGALVTVWWMDSATQSK